MSVSPSVRYMVVCEDMEIVGKKISLSNLILNVISQELPRFPLIQEEICVFVVLAEVRGKGEFYFRIVHADSGTAVFKSEKHVHDFGHDPLKAHGVPCRIRDCSFPEGGLYWLQFWFNDALLAQQELFLK
jgi:hypothetical protein